MTLPPAGQDALRRLLYRQQLLQNEVFALGEDLRALAASQAAPAPPAPTAAQTPTQAALAPTAPGFAAPQPSPMGVGAHGSPAAPGSPPPPPRTPLLQRPGFVAKLLAGAGIAVTLLGISFILVLAAQAGLYGPVPRTITAAALSAALIATATWVHRRDPGNVGAQALFAAGMAAAFLFVVALSVIYAWVPALAALALLWVVGHGATYVARLWDSQFLGVSAVLGALLLTPYVGGREDLAVAVSMLGLTFVSGLLTWDVGWIWLISARYVPTAAYLLYLNVAAGFSGLPGKQWTALGLAALLVAGAITSSIRESPSHPTHHALAPLLLIGPSLPLAVGTTALPRDPAAIVFAALAIAYVAAGLLFPRLPRGVPASFTSIGTLFAVAALREYFGVAGQTLFLAGLATLYLGVGARVRSRTICVLGLVLSSLMAVTWLPALPGILDARLAAQFGPAEVFGSFAGVAVSVAAWFAGRFLLPRARVATLVLCWVAGIGFGAVGTVLGTTLLARGSEESGFQAGHVAVSVMVMIVAGSLLLVGLRAGADAPVFVRMAVAFSGVAVAKLFLWDLATLPGMFRAVTFLIVGLLLLGVGTLYARAYERAQASHRA